MSAMLPYTSMRGYSGLSLRHTGMGEPQKRLRLIVQSRAFSSHLPNEPSLMWSGTHVICWLSATMRSLMAVTFTNHELTAR